MKKLLSMLAFCVFMNNAHAQSTTQTNSTEHTHKHKSDINFKKELNLSHDQVNQWKEIHKNAAEKRKTIMNDNTVSKDQKREQLKNLNNEMLAQVNGILTDDQKAKFSALKEKMKENWKEKHN